MSNIRLMPPHTTGVGSNPCTVNGRTYSCAIGSTIDVPDFDGLMLMANGWTSAGSSVGATAARPTSGLIKGMQFLDTTLGYIVHWDGKVWRNPSTGAAV